MANSEFWDSFAGGVANSMPRGMDYGIKMRDIYDKRQLRSKFAGAEQKYDEDQKALDHLKSFQSKAPQEVQVPDGKGGFETHRTRAISNADLEKYRQLSATNRDQTQKQAFLQHGSPEQYMDFQIKQGQVSKANFEKFIIDGKMGFAKELRDLRNNKAAMVEKAVEMGKLPRGSVFDPKSGQVLTPGKKGQMVPMPISDADINNFMDSYELQGWRRFGAGVDDFLKGQQAEVAFATKGDQIKAAKLANAKTLSDIHLNGAKSHYYGVSADEMQKNGDLGRGIKVGNFIDGTPGGKGGKTQGQDFNPLGKWDKSGVYTIDNVPFIAHTENGLAIPRLDGTGFYSEEEAGSLVDRLIAAGFDVQKINDGGQVIPVIKTLRGPVPLSYGESMLATYARVYGQPTQAIPTTSMHNYAGTGVE